MPDIESHDESKRSRVTFRLLALALVATALGTFAYFNLGQTRFDSNVWKSMPSNDPGRLAMVDDLLAKYRLVGMTQSEIDGMLGIPPQTPYFQDYDYVYWLGPERGVISIDSEWLCIAFDKGVAVEARLMRD